MLKIKSKDSCKWDIVSLGEVMLRLDPGDRRIHTTRSFDVWEGGGEYNVARGLKRCFGMDAAIVTAFADNPIGKLLQDLIYQGGVDQTHVKWVNYDGVGRDVRNGMNFTERGFGVRAALGCSDRGHTAISQLKQGDIDWEQIFGNEGSRWFHTGGIFCALSESTPDVAIEAMEIAKKHGTIISYDINYRDSLWKANGGKTKACEVNRKLAHYVDVMIGGKDDLDESLGVNIKQVDETADEASFLENAFRCTVAEFPNFQAIATTVRNAKSASLNDWGAVCFANDKLYHATMRYDLEIFDRVGGGDSFASGLIYGFLNGESPEWSVNCGAAHGALAMTSSGDTSTVELVDVLRVMKGDSARVAR